ncbi:MAG: YeeE/YedE family protein [Gammaproteobacteria bacterium]|nr:YeeE/YedE family protein [Gammaproteobacteria bacterium]
MIEFTPWSALAGGALIGLAAVALLAFNGRIAGISGIVNGAMTTSPGDRLWRVLFVVGLIVGGVIYQVVTGEALVTREAFSTLQLVAAGLLVGFGTRLGSGCTSGHGVCGIARLSPRSLVATATFLLIGIVTASAVYLLAGGGA